MEEAIWNDFKLRTLLDLNLKVLQTFGHWPPEEATDGKIKLYRIFAILLVGFLFIAYTLTEIINIILVMGDLEKMTESSFLLLTHMAQVFKLYYFTRYNSRIQRLIVSLDRPIFKPRDYKQHIMAKTAIGNARNVYVLFLSMSVSTCILWGIFPLLDAWGGKELKLPLSAWYPFSTEHSLAFAAVYVYQIVGVTMNASTNVSMDTTVSGLMSHICGQLDILNDNLQNIRETCERRLLENLNGDRLDKMHESNCECTNEKGGPLQQEMDKALIGCVHHHRNILDMANEVGELFSISVLSQFTVSVIIMCITMFQLTLVPLFSIQFVSMALYQGCVLLELTVYCWFGNEIILRSSQLSMSAYNLNWTDCSISFKRNLLFIMVRTKMPIKLYAGDFFALSLETFGAILRTSWSYFAVLHRVHDVQ